MSCLSLPQPSHDCFSKIRLVATDMDGTLTTEGKFTPALLQALQDLAAANIKVIIVTGRSAGWVSGLAYYLPVVGAIAENGGLFYSYISKQAVSITPISDLDEHRRNLATVFEKLKLNFPQIKESSDNRFRITDWTFDITGLDNTSLQTMQHQCQELAWGFTYSNVQCHIKPLGQDKAVGLSQVLREYFGEYVSDQVVTVGDSPNDESLFDRNYFAVSVGVANVLEYIDQLQHKPAYITQKKEGEGFCELSDYILQARRKMRS
ncbi:HAD family phosphatase [Plectonema cf. radiosum LEGE 06105]|uniref:HAD family phosphatase n=1 Tax=Plectonema cf. radiosum LEGE 06105 TaxID=945769 RepID=A0A8J7FEX0_9CYAN|nr:HAD family hydrolase [Plectonema radiosum]MBE9216219.1 HAD family phosphatase [Plectonema cf. radiosum LEGE 06105]